MQRNDKFHGIHEKVVGREYSPGGGGSSVREKLGQNAAAAGA